MRATTEVALAVSHIGMKGAPIECWKGTFAHCLIQLAKYMADKSMATRFDLCLARSEEEARGALINRSRKQSGLKLVGDDLESQLLNLMGTDAASSEATQNNCEICGGLNTSCPEGCE